MLEVDGVSKRYGGALAVDALSLKATPGRILGLLGPNGAGKTTTLRMINNIAQPDAGTLRLDGAAIGQATQVHTGYMPEERGLYRQMRVIDQLVYLGQLKGLSRRDARRAANHWLKVLEASDWRHKRPRELSKGMQQKVQFALALLHAPRLIVLDEPFSGLDPLASAVLEQAIAERKAAGAIIVFASHRMEQVEQLCDDVCLIEQGRVLISGDLAEVRQGFGRNTVRLEFAGSGAFVEGLATAGQVEVLNSRAGQVEVRLADGFSAVALLDRARAEVDALHLFSASYPSLREIFLNAVTASRSRREAEAESA